LIDLDPIFEEHAVNTRERRNGAELGTKALLPYILDAKKTSSVILEDIISIAPMENASIPLDRWESNRQTTAQRQEPPDNNIHENEQNAVQSLKPVDGGITAWRVLIAAFIFEALLWGEVLHYFHTTLH
jgi:hypothetical protein